MSFFLPLHRTETLTIPKSRPCTQTGTTPLVVLGCPGSTYPASLGTQYAQSCEPIPYDKSILYTHTDTPLVLFLWRTLIQTLKWYVCYIVLSTFLKLTSHVSFCFLMWLPKIFKYCSSCYMSTGLHWYMCHLHSMNRKLIMHRGKRYSSG